MKKVGIVADNYKLDEFKSQLTKAGYTDFKILPFTKDTSSISIEVPDDQVMEIGKICKKVEYHFKRSN